MAVEVGVGRPAQHHPPVLERARRHLRRAQVAARVDRLRDVVVAGAAAGGPALAHDGGPRALGVAFREPRRGAAAVISGGADGRAARRRRRPGAAPPRAPPARRARAPPPPAARRCFRRGGTPPAWRPRRGPSRSRLLPIREDADAAVVVAHRHTRAHLGVGVRAHPADRFSTYDLERRLPRRAGPLHHPALGVAAPPLEDELLRPAAPRLLAAALDRRRLLEALGQLVLAEPRLEDVGGEDAAQLVLHLVGAHHRVGLGGEAVEGGLELVLVDRLRVVDVDRLEDLRRGRGGG